MSYESQSLLDKIKTTFTKIFGRKKAKVTSFKTPQDLLGSRYGAPSTTIGSPPAERQNPIAAPQTTAPTTHIIPTVLQDGDVSPTGVADSTAYTADRPQSDAVSAMDQEEVTERLNKTSSVQSVQQSALTKTERPVSDIAPVDGAQDIVPNGDRSPEVVGESTTAGIVAQKDVESQPAIDYETKMTDEHTSAEEIRSEGAVPETAASSKDETDVIAPEDRIDPTTAPEVVNEFDDEKVPVEEPLVSSPIDTKIKMSATSGPLEDFPIGGEYYV